MGVDGISQITDSSSDEFREDFDDLWWYVDGFGCGGSSLLASTVGGLSSEETPTAQRPQAPLPLSLRLRWLRKSENYSVSQPANESVTQFIYCSE